MSSVVYNKFVKKNLLFKIFLVFLLAFVSLFLFFNKKVNKKADYTIDIKQVETTKLEPNKYNQLSNIYKNGDAWSFIYPNTWDIYLVKNRWEFREEEGYEYTLELTDGTSKLTLNEKSGPVGDPYIYEKQYFDELKKEHCNIFYTKNSSNVTFHDEVYICSCGTANYGEYNSDPSFYTEHSLDTPVIKKKSKCVYRLQYSDDKNTYSIIDNFYNKQLNYLSRTHTQDPRFIYTQFSYIESDDDVFIKNAMDIFFSVFNEI